MNRNRLPVGLAAFITLAALSGCGAIEADSAALQQQTTEVVEADAVSSTAPSEAQAASDDSADAPSSTAVDEASDVGAEPTTAPVVAGEGLAVALSDSGGVSGEGVTNENGVVTVTEAGLYELSGTLSAGQIVVDAPDDAIVMMVLSGVEVTNPSGPALHVVNADEVTIVLAEESVNALTDGDGYSASASTTAAEDAVDAPNAALYSTADLTISGSGTLTVDGNDTDGISSKDDLVINGGTIVVEADDDGIRGKDSLTVNDGAITVNALGDALTADNTGDEDGSTEAVGHVVIAGGSLNLAANIDGIDAANTVTIGGGSLQIAAGDDAVHADLLLSVSGGTTVISQSYEGLEGAAVTISGGDVSVVSSDDGINIAGGAGGTSRQGGGGSASSGASNFSMSGGNVLVNASGDGLDVNASASITGGELVVNGPTANNNAALDVDGLFHVSGGVVIGAGSSGMAMAPSGDGQGVLEMTFRSALPAGTKVVLSDADGGEVVAFQSIKSVSSLVVSSPSIVSGSAYSVSVDGVDLASAVTAE